jgi:hypothetical protein
MQMAKLSPISPASNGFDLLFDGWKVEARIHSSIIQELSATGLPICKARVRTVLDNHWAQISLNMFRLIFSLIVLFLLRMGIHASSFSWAVKSPSCKERSKLQHITWSTLIDNIFSARRFTASKAWERIRGLQFNPPLESVLDFRLPA